MQAQGYYNLEGLKSSIGHLVHLGCYMGALSAVQEAALQQQPGYVRV